MKSLKIYGLVDPRDATIRYVGRTTGDLQVRLKAHLSLAIRTRKTDWLNELSAVGLQPSIRWLDEVSGDDQDAERRWIEQLTSGGARLTNDRLQPSLARASTQLPRLKYTVKRRLQIP